MGTGVEVIQQRWSPTESRRHPTSNLHKEAIQEPAQELGVLVDTATHRSQLVIYLRQDLWLPRRR
jgi:hypothetical protein